MVQFDNSALPPPSDLLSALKAVPERPAFVHQIRLDDESISAALRGKTDLHILRSAHDPDYWRQQICREQARTLLFQIREASNAVRELSLYDGLPVRRVRDGLEVRRTVRWSNPSELS